MADKTDYSQEIRSSKYEGLETTPDSLDKLLNPLEFLEVIRYSLLSYKYNRKKGEWEAVKGLEPIMSIEGVEDLMRDLWATLGVPNVLGNLNDAQYNRLIFRLGTGVIKFIFFKSGKYNIDTADFDRIVNVIIVNTTIFLSRAKSGFQAEGVSKIFGVKENVSRRESERYSDEKPQGGMPGINFWRRKR